MTQIGLFCNVPFDDQQSWANIVEMRFDIRDLAGTSVDTVTVGDEFELNIFVQDIRSDSEPDRGVFSSYLDVFYDASLLSVAGPLEFGATYEFFEDTSDLSSPGVVNDAGNVQTDFGFGGPTGPDEFLLFKVPMRADAGTSGSPTLLWGEPADNPPATDVFVFTDPFDVVPTGDIVYGSDMLTILNGINGCDFNLDAACDLDDINLMFEQGNLGTGIVTSAPTEKFDLIDDNVINQSDILEWLAQAATQNGYASPYLRGDVDGVSEVFPGPRDVDITDFNFLAVNYDGIGDGDPTNGPFWHQGNFDGDDDVDITDFNFLAVSFQGGEYGTSFAVPEPSLLVLWSLGLVGAMLIGRVFVR